MATNVKLKRSAVHAKVPTTSALQLGELAINTYDGYVFLKRDGLNGEEIIRFRGNCATDESVILNTSVHTFFLMELSHLVKHQH